MKNFKPLFFLLSYLSLSTPASAALVSANCRLGLLFTLIAAPPDSCDVLITKNGETYNIRIVQEDSLQIRYTFCGERELEHTLLKSRIRSIKRAPAALMEFALLEKDARGALTCGILGLVFMCLGVLALGGLILGIIALSKGLRVLRRLGNRRSGAGRKIHSRAVAGVVLGGVIVGLALLAIAFLILVVVLFL